MANKILLLLVATMTYAEEFHYPGHEFDKTALGDAIDRASLRLFKEAYEEADDKNVVASPLGVLTLLSLYASAAEGENRDEIIQALGSSNYSQLYNSYSELSREFSEMDSSFMALINKVYVSDQYTLSDEFSNVAARSYKSEFERISFLDTAAATATINHWAEQKTNGHLKNPVPDDAITPDAAAALFNIIFFQGHWDVPFDVTETKEEDFFLDKATTVKKPTMHLLQPLFYYESKELRARLVELPYKETHFRMVVVLPDDVDGLPSLVEKASTHGLLTDIFALEPTGVDIDLYIPKFEVESGLDLNKLLPKIGVSRIFYEPAHGLVKEQGVHVSKAFQKAFVKVDEEGATAGAFTGLVVVPESLNYEPPKPLELRVNHPFVFLILYQDKIIFTGTYAH